MWTDMWAAYNQLPNIAAGYQHGTVNHTLHLVDPNIGVCTNRVETIWSQAKDKFKGGRGPTNRGMIADFLAEFMWAQRFGEGSTFYHLWTESPGTSTHCRGTNPTALFRANHTLKKESQRLLSNERKQNL